MLEDEDYNSIWFNIWLIWFFFWLLYFLAVCVVVENWEKAEKRKEMRNYSLVYFNLDIGK